MAAIKSVSVFDRLLVKGVAAGQAPGKTQEARDWYRNSIKGFKSKVDENAFLKSDVSRLTNKPKVGSMYMYLYDPKHKDTLPYYDTCPLIFMVEQTEDGFYGINLHYLPPILRAKLMDGLYTLSNNKRYDDTTKLKLSYQLLKATAGAKYFAPCFKRYLHNHLRTQFMYIAPQFWDQALFLPTARFKKQTNTQVYAASKRSLGITKR